MFKNIFTKFSFLGNTSQNRTMLPLSSSNVIFLGTELVFNLIRFIKLKINKKNITFVKIDLPMVKKLPARVNKIKVKQLYIHLNQRFFYIKEQLLEVVTNQPLMFRREWKLLYDNSMSSHQIWLYYTHRPYYYFKHLFHLRQTPLISLFNVNKKKTGIYEYKYDYNYFNIYWGFVSFWAALRIWVFSLIFFFLSFYVLMIKRTCVLPQTLFFWIGLMMLLYWLLSGFVFFVKKYQYSRFTSVIQRFWRRSYILFWLIESGLLLVFFYLVINASQESFYMFDQGYFFKTHLFSWKLFLFKCILIVSLITYSYLLLLNLKWSVFNKNLSNLLVLTILLLYLVWTEFYQIYWVANFYANFSWLYDVEETVWSLEFDGRRTRILNHYIMVLFLLKFWHIIFIFGCWIFFLLRSNELDTITYPLYSFNVQNFIILFLMMWLFMYPWIKHTFHWIGEIPYYWFYVDIHITFYKIFVHDFINFYYNILISIFNYINNINFMLTDFINWSLIDSHHNYSVFIKTTIKNEILKSLI